jgi:hypothetical protein
MSGRIYKVFVKLYVKQPYAIYRKPIWLLEFNVRNTTLADPWSLLLLLVITLVSSTAVCRNDMLSGITTGRGGNLTAIGNTYKNFVSQIMHPSENR